MEDNLSPMEINGSSVLHVRVFDLITVFFFKFHLAGFKVEQILHLKVWSV